MRKILSKRNRAQVFEGGVQVRATYDAEGNRLTKTEIATSYVTEYTWDHRGRLNKITNKDDTGTVGETIEYTYDLFGRRLSKSVAPGVGPADPSDFEIYIYDGEHIALQFDGNGVDQPLFARSGSRPDPRR